MIILSFDAILVNGLEATHFKNGLRNVLTHGHAEKSQSPQLVADSTLRDLALLYREHLRK